MRVIDTCIFIEWLTQGQLAEDVEPFLTDPQQLMIPTIVQLELYKWLLRERDENQADQMLAFTMGCQVIDLSTALAIQAAELHQKYKLALADAIVYATACAHQAELITSDAHFAGLPSVHYLKKTPHQPR